MREHCNFPKEEGEVLARITVLAYIFMLDYMNGGTLARDSALTVQEASDRLYSAAKALRAGMISVNDIGKS